MAADRLPKSCRVGPARFERRPTNAALIDGVVHRVVGRRGEAPLVPPYKPRLLLVYRLGRRSVLARRGRFGGGLARDGQRFQRELQAANQQARVGVQAEHLETLIAAFQDFDRVAALVSVSGKRLYLSRGVMRDSASGRASALRAKTEGNTRRADALPLAENISFVAA